MTVSNPGGLHPFAYGPGHRPAYGPQTKAIGRCEVVEGQVRSDRSVAVLDDDADRVRDRSAPADAPQ
jgi:hypothetical protein